VVQDLKQRAAEIVRRLRKAYPAAHCELQYTTPLQLLIATILSAQCTDAKVNETTPALFQKHPDAKALSKVSSAELEKLIHSCGFYKNKARAIQDCCLQLTLEHGGEVPESMEALLSLAGVGRKTANLVRAYAFGRPGMICDTHVLRLSERLGLAREKNPDKVEAELAALLPDRDWTDFSTLLMTHGRRCCTAKKPACGSCELHDLCPSADTF
jgi:endonuclease III